METISVALNDLIFQTYLISFSTIQSYAPNVAFLLVVILKAMLPAFYVQSWYGPAIQAQKRRG
jgi:uncharacterized membrane protein YjgN (DUF898 family)